MYGILSLTMRLINLHQLFTASPVGWTLLRASLSIYPYFNIIYASYWTNLSWQTVEFEIKFYNMHSECFLPFKILFRGMYQIKTVFFSEKSCVYSEKKKRKVFLKNVYVCNFCNDVTSILLRRMCFI